MTNLSDKRDCPAPVLAILKQFRNDVDNLNGKSVHSLFNTMTMEKNAHDVFNHLELWFEKTDTVNHYNVRTSGLFLLTQDQVTFTTPDPVKLPLPSPDLLALHATCAQIADLSGAGEYVDQILDDMEKIDVLEHNGTSSEVLHHALMTLNS
ncbi:hypothetical protein EI94DRAFT_1712881 [Lactarius quietus]|nr:hypothetical protein EI94DRAFT_1712881 [Lactarius quietus]